MIRRVHGASQVKACQRAAAVATASLKRAFSWQHATRNRVIFPCAGCSAGSTASRPEPTTVTNVGDDVWAAEKFQSNSEIAGSPRNACRCSRGIFPPVEVERWMGAGLRGSYQSQPNCECHSERPTSEAVGANLHCRKGNNPAHQLRSPNDGSVDKVVVPHRQPGGWLRSSHPCKSA
jgi:hypothetical protein